MAGPPHVGAGQDWINEAGAPHSLKDQDRLRVDANLDRFTGQRCRRSKAVTRLQQHLMAGGGMINRIRYIIP
ncbi:hypothetical protein C8J34_11610 [Rhizobium sp. PP-F2F-G36]|nr:hypothetical protein C8J34_11610 [Rhizobium sp. PP-F2F-G36]